MCIHNFLESCVSTTTGLDGARGAPLHIERRIGIRIHVDVRLDGLQCLIEQRVVESCVTDQTPVDFLPALANNPTKCNTLDMTSSNGLPSNSIAAFFVKRNMAVQSNEQRKTLDRYQRHVLCSDLHSWTAQSSRRNVLRGPRRVETCFVKRIQNEDHPAIVSNTTQKNESCTHTTTSSTWKGLANSPVERCRIMTASNTT